MLHIDWDRPVIDEQAVLTIQPADLNDFYCAADSFDKTNMFFVLLASYHHYLDNGHREKAAHLCYLIAYYLFVPLTPPGSCELAMHYITQAVSLCPLESYTELLSLIEKGN